MFVINAHNKLKGFNLATENEDKEINKIKNNVL